MLLGERDLEENREEGESVIGLEKKLIHFFKKSPHSIKPLAESSFLINQWQ